MLIKKSRTIFRKLKYLEGLQNLFLLETWIEHAMPEEDLSRHAAKRIIREAIHDFEGYLEVVAESVEKAVSHE